MYSMGISLALHEGERVEVMVVNPRASRKFAESQMVRGKTDRVDARVLRHYPGAVAFVPWAPPSEEVIELQVLSRRIKQLDKELTGERNRLHAVSYRGAVAKRIAQDLEGHIRELERRMEKLHEYTLAFVHEQASLAADYEIIDPAPGGAERTTPALMAELMVLPGDMSAPQWVAQAGFDPKPVDSGQVKSKRQISKVGNPRIRAAIFWSAMVAIQRDANVKAFYEHLLAKGKAKMQAVTAVMRKLLHALWGMLHNREKWDGNKFYCIPLEA